MEESRRKQFITTLQKVERKYQVLHHSSDKFKNPELKKTLWNMESETRQLIRRLEKGDDISDAEANAAVMKIQKFEPKIQKYLAAEKELDNLADDVERMWAIFVGMKGDAASKGDESPYKEFIEQGDDLQSLFRSIKDRSIRTPKDIQKYLSAFGDSLKKVQKAMES